MDHIIEKQLIGNAIAKVYTCNSEKYIMPIRDTINEIYNLNVTNSKVNKSKGQLIKKFLYDGMYDGDSLRAILLYSTYECNPYFENIKDALLDTQPELTENIKSLRLDGRVTGNHEFTKVSDEIDQLFSQMKLDDENTPTELRNKKVLSKK